jgi:hypothetical protein
MRTVLHMMIAIAICAVAADASERSKQKKMKGVELYSWQSDNGDWLFALVTGTNRLKSEQEIKTQAILITGVRALKTEFEHLAEGEHVFWNMHRHVPGFRNPDQLLMYHLM